MGSMHETIRGTGRDGALARLSDEELDARLLQLSLEYVDAQEREAELIGCAIGGQAGEIGDDELAQVGEVGELHAAVVALVGEQVRRARARQTAA